MTLQYKFKDEFLIVDEIITVNLLFDLFSDMCIYFVKILIFHWSICLCNRKIPIAVYPIRRNPKIDPSDACCYCNKLQV